MRTKIKKITFFQKVCQFVNVTASPKHPQSLTGSATANHKVKGVNIIRIVNADQDVSLEKK